MEVAQFERDFPIVPRADFRISLFEYAPCSGDVVFHQVPREFESVEIRRTERIVVRVVHESAGKFQRGFDFFLSDERFQSSEGRDFPFPPFYPRLPFQFSAVRSEKFAFPSERELFRGRLLRDRVSEKKLVERFVHEFVVSGSVVTKQEAQMGVVVPVFFRFGHSGGFFERVFSEFRHPNPYVFFGIVVLSFGSFRMVGENESRDFFEHFAPRPYFLGLRNIGYAFVHKANEGHEQRAFTYFLSEFQRVRVRENLFRPLGFVPVFDERFEPYRQEMDFVEVLFVFRIFSRPRSDDAAFRETGYRRFYRFFLPGIPDFVDSVKTERLSVFPVRGPEVSIFPKPSGVEFFRVEKPYGASVQGHPFYELRNPDAFSLSDGGLENEIAVPGAIEDLFEEVFPFQFEDSRIERNVRNRFRTVFFRFRNGEPFFFAVPFYVSGPLDDSPRGAFTYERIDRPFLFFPRFPILADVGEETFGPFRRSDLREGRETRRRIFVFFSEMPDDEFPVSHGDAPIRRCVAPIHFGQSRGVVPRFRQPLEGVRLAMTVRHSVFVAPDVRQA